MYIWVLLASIAAYFAIKPSDKVKETWVRRARYVAAFFAFAATNSAWLTSANSTSPNNLANFMAVLAIVWVFFVLGSYLVVRAVGALVNKRGFIQEKALAAGQKAVASHRSLSAGKSAAMTTVKKSRQVPPQVKAEKDDLVPDPFMSLDDQLFERVSGELDRDEKDIGLWTKAFVLADGDEIKQKVHYIRLRVKKLADLDKDAQDEDERPLTSAQNAIKKLDELDNDAQDEDERPLTSAQQAANAIKKLDDLDKKNA